MAQYIVLQSKKSARITANDSRQKGRATNRIRELERIYGVRNGSAISTRGSNGTSGKSDMTQQELAERMGIDLNTLKRAKALTTLTPEIQDLVEQGNISTSTASRLIAKLSPEEQEKLISTLPVSEHFTQKQVQSYVDQIHMKDNQIAGYELKAEQDKQEKERLRTELEEARNVEPETVVKEVVPDDYEKLKSDKERLASENKLLKSERDTLKKDYQARCKEVNEMRDTMSAIREDSAREDIMDELEQDCIFFCARCDSFLKAVGGYAYLANKLNRMQEIKRNEYMIAVNAMYAWCQNIVYAMREHYQTIKKEPHQSAEIVADIAIMKKMYPNLFQQGEPKYYEPNDFDSVDL